MSKNTQILARIATVARDGCRQANCGGGIRRPIWIGALYEARPRKRDGVHTWRRVGSFGRDASGDGPSDALIADLKADAPAPWLDGVRHGQPVTAEQLDALVAYDRAIVRGLDPHCECDDCRLARTAT